MYSCAAVRATIQAWKVPEEFQIIAFDHLIEREISITAENKQVKELKSTQAELKAELKSERAAKDGVNKLLWEAQAKLLENDKQVKELKSTQAELKSERAAKDGVSKLLWEAQAKLLENEKVLSLLNGRIREYVDSVSEIAPRAIIG